MKAYGDTLTLERIDYTQPIEFDAIAGVISRIDTIVDPEIRRARTTALVNHWKYLGTVAAAVEPSTDPLSWSVRDALDELEPNEEHSIDHPQVRAVEAMLSEGSYLSDQKHHPFRTPSRDISFLEQGPGLLPATTEEQTANFFGVSLIDKLATLDALEILRHDPNFFYPYQLPRLDTGEYFRQVQFDHLSNLIMTAEDIGQLVNYDGHIHVPGEGRRRVSYPDTPALAVSVLGTAAELLHVYSSDYGAGFTLGSSEHASVDPEHSTITLSYEFVETAKNLAATFSSKVEGYTDALDKHYKGKYGYKLSDDQIEHHKTQLQLHQEALAALRHVYAKISDVLLQGYTYHANIIMHQMGEPPRSDKQLAEMWEAWPAGLRELQRVRGAITALVEPAQLEVEQPLSQDADEVCAAIDKYSPTRDRLKGLIGKVAHGYSWRREQRRNYRLWDKYAVNKDY